MADGQHEDKSDHDGQRDDYDHSKTKDVSESGSGKHDNEDRGDK
jgi:hypothetical protein